MIISCDPPRHALLIHFGRRQHSRPPEVLCPRPGIEIALGHPADALPGLSEPRLVAIHFVRHKFYLPFVGRYGLADSTHITFRRTPEEVQFDFDLDPRRYGQEEVAAGLQILLIPPKPGGRDRPLLGGFRVGLRALPIDFDTEEMVFECGADNLKDVPVTLFCRS